MTTTIKHAVAWTITSFISLLTLIGLFFAFGDDAESLLLPPLFSDITGAYVKFTADQADIVLTGNKARNCMLTAASVHVKTDKSWVSGQVQMLKRDGSRLSIEEQRIAVGSPFVRLLQVKPGGPEMKLTLESQCHSLWNTRQHIHLKTDPNAIGGVRLH